jgi:hypothetical protein
MRNILIEKPYYPIIYVRGYAGADAEVEDTASDPYMGFNIGSTRTRTAWTGATERFYFESPLVRLMKDFEYRDVYSSGLNAADFATNTTEQISSRSIIIYRYYDNVSSIFGSGKQVAMEEFGKGLSDLILKLQTRVCGENAPEEECNKFRVYLVGHSMGGLVIRSFLQNDEIGSPAAKKLVDKVFTYATPHNGIELDIVGNIPAFFTYHSVDDFNRKRMCEYLGLPAGTEPVNTLNNKFDADKFFCLVGTNAKDYTVAKGWSARIVGPFSDGLVRINNAVLSEATASPNNPAKIAPRAYVHRSHSGYYGIVNSEEGYQNLTRFLFGDVRVNGVLEVHDITLPAELETERQAGRQVRASYQFEAIAKVRGAHWDLSRRVANENSTVFRKYGELFQDKAGPEDRSCHDFPELFTLFLSSDLRVDLQRRSLGFALDLGVLVPDYELDGILWLKTHFQGGYILRDKINFEATPPKTQNETWRLRYGFDSRSPNAVTLSADGVAKEGCLEFRIPIIQKHRPGINATLILTATRWNC